MRVNRPNLDFARQVDALARQGTPVRDIAAALGITHATLYSRIRRLGLKFDHASTGRLCCIRSGEDLCSLIATGALKD